jgi:hypothetical protein
MPRGAMKWILALSVLFTGACREDAVVPISQIESLNIVVSADPVTFSPGEAVTVTVEVENLTESRIMVPMTSSSCQFAAVIRYGDGDCVILDPRICTCDAPTVSFDPGECRTESWTWTGEIFVNGVPQRLPPGLYELRGVAGRFKGAPIIVDVTD